jgi:hypothetical protein
MAALAALITGLAVYGVYAREREQAAAIDAPTAPGGLFREEQARGTSLTAVGSTEGLDRPCTAWLLDVGAPADAPALAVTAGRCVGIEDSTTVLADVPASGSVSFNTFAALTSADYVAPVVSSAERIVWASMRGTDLAVLRLGASYAELSAQGVDPIAPVSALADGGEVLVAGVPVEGVPEDEQNLRGSRCSVGATTDVAEVPWIFQSMQVSGCAGILEGSAGSPAFNSAGEAVGMVTTTTIGAPEATDCALGRPCEVGQGSVSLRTDTSYVLPVGQLAGCFPGGALTLGDGCALEDPATVVVASVGSTEVEAGADLEVSIEGTAPPSVSAKQGMLGSVDCWDQAGWVPALVSEGSLVVTAPSAQGLGLLCVGASSQPTPILLTVSGQAPASGDFELAQVPVEGGVEVRPVPEPPQYSTFTWVSGPAGTIDCATAEGYTEFVGEPALIEAADLPSTVCVIAYDESGTPSEPVAFEVE